MLIGPPYQPSLPDPPREPNANLKDILEYLRDLPESVGKSLQAIVANTVGLGGVRGISSSGIIPRNFVKQALYIGNTTSASWVFSNIEADASYLIFYSPSVSTGVVLTQQTRTTTAVNFVFNPAVPSGALLDVLLLR